MITFQKKKLLSQLLSISNDAEYFLTWLILSFLKVWWKFSAVKRLVKHFELVENIEIFCVVIGKYLFCSSFLNICSILLWDRL